MARRTKAQIEADKITAQESEIQDFHTLIREHPCQPYVRKVLATNHRALPTGQVVSARAVEFGFPISETIIGIASSNVGDLPNQKLGGMVAHYKALQAAKAALVAAGYQF